MTEPVGLGLSLDDLIKKSSASEGRGGSRGGRGGNAAGGRGGGRALALGVKTGGVGKKPIPAFNANQGGRGGGFNAAGRGRGGGFQGNGVSGGRGGGYHSNGMGGNQQRQQGFVAGQQQGGGNGQVPRLMQRGALSDGISNGGGGRGGGGNTAGGNYGRGGGRGGGGAQYSGRGGGGGGNLGMAATATPVVPVVPLISTGPPPLSYLSTFSNAAGDVIVRLENIDIVSITAAGQVTLSTGGYPTEAVLNAMNRVLALIGAKVIAQSPVQWVVTVGGAMQRFQDGIRIPARGPATSGRAQTIYDVFSEDGYARPDAADFTSAALTASRTVTGAADGGFVAVPATGVGRAGSGLQARGAGSAAAAAGGWGAALPAQVANTMAANAAAMMAGYKLVQQAKAQAAAGAGGGYALPAGYQTAGTTNGRSGGRAAAVTAADEDDPMDEEDEVPVARGSGGRASAGAAVFGRLGSERTGSAGVDEYGSRRGVVESDEARRLRSQGRYRQ